MIRRTLRLGTRLGLLAGIGYAVAKLVQRQRAGGNGHTAPAAPGWQPPPSPKPAPAKPSEAAKPAPAKPSGAAKPAETKAPVEPKAAVAPLPAPPRAPAPPTDAAPSSPSLPSKPPRTPSPRGSAGAAKKAPPAKKATTKKQPATKPAAAKPSTAGARVWVEPNGTECPTSHPVKAKTTTRIFHLPGMWAYDRTRPDRCYRDEPAAVADGLTKSKR